MKGIIAGLILGVIFLTGIFFRIKLEEKAALQTKASILEQQYEDFYKKFQSSKAILNTLMQYFKEAEIKTGKYKTQIANLGRKLKDSEEEVEKLTRQMSSIKISKEKGENRFDETSRKTKKGKSNFSEKEKLTEVKRSLEGKKKESAKLQKQLDKTLKGNMALTNDNEALQGEINKLKAEKENLYKEEEQLKVLLSRQSEKEGGIDSLNEKNQVLEERLYQLSRNLEEKNREINILRAGKEKLEADVSKSQVEKLYMEKEWKGIKLEQEQTNKLLDEISYFNYAVKEKLDGFSQYHKGKIGEEENIDNSKKRFNEGSGSNSNRTVEVILTP